MNLARFELIDEVRAVNLAAGSIVCAARLPAHAPLFDGHFPGHPLLPGVIQAEIQAQAAGVLLMARHQRRKMFYLVALERMRFRREVPPGAVVEALAQVTYDNEQLAVCACSLRLDERVVAEGEVRLAAAEVSKPALRAHMTGLLTRLGLDVTVDHQGLGGDVTADVRALGGPSQRIS